jgi:hypothetical protein
MVSIVPVEAVVVSGGIAQAGELVLSPLVQRLNVGDLLPTAIARRGTGRKRKQTTANSCKRQAGVTVNRADGREN